MFTQLCFFFYTTIVLLVLQMIFIIWRCNSLLGSFVQWVCPSLWRKTHCVWCWKSCHILHWWPERWTSTICYHHVRVTAKQHASYRAAKAARQPTACIASVLASSEHSDLVEVLQ